VAHHVDIAGRDFDSELVGRDCGHVAIVSPPAFIGGSKIDDPR
jgi:hypothetical protein